MLELLQKIDINTLKLIHDYSQNYILDKIMPFITFLGNLGLVWIVISIILISSKKYRTIGIMCILVLIFNTILGEGILKNLIQRQRPFMSMSTVHLLIDKPISFSFPSGHTSTSFAIAGIIWSQLKKYRVYVVLLACLIAFSRLYLFVHYPSDILGGIVQGLVCAKIVLKVYPTGGKRIPDIFTHGN
jgi:Membrane-associated phospholipid phosphatase